MKLSLSACSIAAATAISTLTLPVAGSADSLPSYAANGAETIHGRIASIPGKYDLYVRDDRGYVDHVVLHDGTVINPTGLELAAGETVTITGRNAGRVFRADEVDTPYSDDMPSNSYDGPGNGYEAYPVGYGNPYGFGYPDAGGIYFGGPYFGGPDFGGGYYGGGYSGHGYRGHGSYGGGSYNRESHARGGASGRTGSSGGARGVSGGGSAHH